MIFSAPASRAPWIGAAADAAAADHHDESPGATSAVLTADPQPGRDAAAEQAGPRERQVVVDLHQRRFGHGAVLGERADERHHTDVLPARVAPVGAVELGARHDHRAEIAEVLMAGRAEPAAPACRQERRDDVVAGRQADDARPDLLHDPCALVPADQRQRGR